MLRLRSDLKPVTVVSNIIHHSLKPKPLYRWRYSESFPTVDLGHWFHNNRLFNMIIPYSSMIRVSYQV